MRLWVVCRARWSTINFRQNELICSEKKLSLLMKGVECWTTLEEIKRYFNGQEACTFLVGHYASIEIVLVLYRTMSSKFSALFHCSLETFWCKLIILFYDNGAQRNVKITHNNKRIIDIFWHSHWLLSKQQNNTADL